ncbi:hypothetical protein MTBPR1_50129 [Candidatus Terasakiella magnetica]|uniref:Uncharacterized protein n=1 Tax=Candidatus Terasakiella magnetica TaxID=1867952 RepID=A0A1C3RJG8_9PROT|nr:hypothetical protein MTBPR1_50129 [Candidatus Terasakiella magnetica]
MDQLSLNTTDHIDIKGEVALSAFPFFSCLRNIISKELRY